MSTPSSMRRRTSSSSAPLQGEEGFEHQLYVRTRKGQGYMRKDELVEELETIGGITFDGEAPVVAELQHKWLEMHRNLGEQSKYWPAGGDSDSEENDGEVFDAGAASIPADKREEDVSEAQRLDPVPENVWAKIWKRTYTSVIMFSTFGAIVYGGAMYVTVMIAIMQTAVFRELVNVRYARYQKHKVIASTDDSTVVTRGKRRFSIADIKSNITKNKPLMNPEIPMFRSLQYAWFMVGMFYTYGDFIAVHARTAPSLQFLRPYLHYHLGASFTLISTMIVASILSLRPESLRYQFGHLMWTIVILILVCGQMMKASEMSHKGVFWFFFPAFLVINNDSWAYVWGMLLGKKITSRQFLALSPKKTWEGFIGAGVMTLIVAYFFADYLSRPLLGSHWMVCPTSTLTFRYHAVDGCDLDPIFELQTRNVHPIIQTLSLGYIGETIEVKRIQLHALAFAFFASSVAPFGGFMASAIKRAHQVKDFDSLIPGHGGFMDRLDCQMIMSIFVWIYYRSIIEDFSDDKSQCYKLWTQLSAQDKTSLLANFTADMAS